VCVCVCVCASGVRVRVRVYIWITHHHSSWCAIFSFALCTITDGNASHSSRAREAYKLIRDLPRHPNITVPLVSLARKTSQELYLFFAHSSTTLRREIDARKAKSTAYFPRASEVILWATDICRGLLHLTNVGVVHGDIRVCV
jgi:hypothetical protein